jgi:hypothetical protein
MACLPTTKTATRSGARVHFERATAVREDLAAAEAAWWAWYHAGWLGERPAISPDLAAQLAATIVATSHDLRDATAAAREVRRCIRW